MIRLVPLAGLAPVAQLSQNTLRGDGFVNDLVQILAVVPASLLRAVIILALSIFFGTILALLAQHRIPVVTQVIHVYVSFFRGVPVLVQLMFWYYFLPQLVGAALRTAGLPGTGADDLSADAILIFTYVLCFSAYLTETATAALNSVPAEQRQLAASLGYSPWQATLRVVLPQAALYALPNICNMFVMLVKVLSLGFTIAVVDIFAEAKIIAGFYGDYIVVYTADALVFWGLCIVLTIASNHVIRATGSRRGVADFELA
ncbi:amino acid ABC transporter permease [Bifidobacterium choloepi]|uniref:ABC transporter permease subunit n=1 Tax=Bifidobacterium choloepi TaxID=2614131 RepID=A0A6I5MZ82_9BIFI|nr:ABC transporter permease subunit [Bifidobacterium choloepi]NEG69597.1 ABC transporter permease subunit [Bifidobacterium choloepi]